MRAGNGLVSRSQSQRFAGIVAYMYTVNIACVELFNAMMYRATARIGRAASRRACVLHALAAE